MKSALLLLASLVALLRCDAFVSTAPSFVRTAASSSSSSLQMTVLSYNGKKRDFKAGSPLSSACSALGAKVTYSCKKGDCATCQISLAGRMTKPCVAKVPAAPTLKSLQEKGLEIKTF